MRTKLRAAIKFLCLVSHEVDALGDRDGGTHSVKFHMFPGQGFFAMVFSLACFCYGLFAAHGGRLCGFTVETESFILHSLC